MRFPIAFQPGEYTWGDALHAGLKLRQWMGGELLEIAVGMIKSDMDGGGVVAIGRSGTLLPRGSGGHSRQADRVDGALGHSGLG
jgi:hypothetical protein